MSGQALRYGPWRQDSEQDEFPVIPVRSSEMRTMLEIHFIVKTAPSPPTDRGAASTQLRRVNWRGLAPLLLILCEASLWCRPLTTLCARDWEDQLAQYDVVVIGSAPEATSQRSAAANLGSRPPSSRRTLALAAPV